MTEHTEAAKPAENTDVVTAAAEAPAVVSETTAAEAASAPQPAADILSVEVSKFEAHSIDRPVTDSISLAAPQIEMPKVEAPDDTAAPARAANPYLARLWQHAPLAASLTIAALLGALAGAAATGGFASEPPKPAVETRTAADETRALRETLVRIGSELQTLKASVDTANRNAGTQINKLSERIDRTEKAQAEPAAKLARIVESLDRLEKRQVAALAPTTTVAAHQPAAAPETTGSVDKVQSKPPVVEGWKLHEFFGGRAVVENRTTGNLFEVGPGSNLPGLGRVETIRREDNRIVIVTPKGIISAQLDHRRQPYYPPYR
jgi:hypothetical protein